VADYAPEKPAGEKMPKTPDQLNLSLRPTPDIAATLGALKQPHQRTIGIALQDQHAREHAREKLAAKKLDMIILNHLDAMNADQAAYEALRTGQADFENWGTLTKPACAARIFDAAMSC
jgi:phosphopantothenoylcysteine synthetase/decarboxylase